MRKLLRRTRWWHRLVLVVCAPLAALNLAVAFFGQSAVFPLSPFFLEEKWSALKAYARHRPSCLFRGGHDDVVAIAHAAERRHHLPAGLMRAIVEVESASEAHRISAAGAMGPAQLMPGTARMLGVADPFDPRTSVDAGARYLRTLLTRTGGDVRLAVASYNAGPGNVTDRVPRNGQTEYYVARVMRRLREE